MWDHCLELCFWGTEKHFFSKVIIGISLEYLGKNKKKYYNFNSNTEYRFLVNQVSNDEFS